MKKLLGILVLVLIIGGFYLNDKNKKLNKAKLICKDHFKTSDQKCIDKYWNYPRKLSYQISEKKWPEYKKTIQKIEDEIDELKNTELNINILEYSYTSAQEIEFDFYKKLKNKKIIIGGANSGSFFEPNCSGWRSTSDYFVCLKQRVMDESGDDQYKTTTVKISNINKFPKIKEIIDKLNNYDFPHYKIIVYGRIIENKVLNKIIEADFIILERLNLEDRVYENALRTDIYRTKRKELSDYMEANYPKKK